MIQLVIVCVFVSKGSSKRKSVTTCKQHISFFSQSPKQFKYVQFNKKNYYESPKSLIQKNVIANEIK